MNYAKNIWMTLTIILEKQLTSGALETNGKFTFQFIIYEYKRYTSCMNYEKFLNSNKNMRTNFNVLCIYYVNLIMTSLQSTTICT